MIIIFLLWLLSSSSLSLSSSLLLLLLLLLLCSLIIHWLSFQNFCCYLLQLILWEWTTTCCQRSHRVLHNDAHDDFFKHPKNGLKIFAVSNKAISLFIFYFHVNPNCYLYNLKNLIKVTTCFKNPEFPTSADYLIKKFS